MKNIHILPTDKPSRLFRLANYLIFDKETEVADKRNQHIYITSDEEIKDVRPHDGRWQLETGQILNKFPNYLTDLSECKLVIMTTDQDLIKDGVQAIDDEFLEWFGKNPRCESVEVTHQLHFNEPLYVINTRKEELKQETLEETYLNELIDEANKEFTLDKKLAKEVAIKFSKWQEQRMYSEEEVAIAFNEGQAYSVTGKLVDGKEWVKTHKKEWFNKFKKK